MSVPGDVELPSGLRWLPVSTEVVDLKRRLRSGSSTR